jgi:hypothetical protein
MLRVVIPARGQSPKSRTQQDCRSFRIRRPLPIDVIAHATKGRDVLAAAKTQLRVIRTGGFIACAYVTASDTKSYGFRVKLGRFCSWSGVMICETSCVCALISAAGTAATSTVVETCDTDREHRR